MDFELVVLKYFWYWYIGLVGLGSEKFVKKWMFWYF